MVMVPDNYKLFISTLDTEIKATVRKDGRVIDNSAREGIVRANC